MNLFRKLVLNSGIENVVYLDESGFDGKENFRRSGWSKKGVKIHDKISGKRWTRTSLLMAQRCKKWISPLLFNGTCDNIVKLNVLAS